jgi:methyl-accepting chemotaxis protein
MSVRIKVLALIGLTALVSLLGYALMLGNIREAGDAYVGETHNAIRNRVATEAEAINTYMAVMQEKTRDIATAGESLYAIHQAADADMEPRVRDFLTTSIRRYPEAIGCGVWYEPHTFFADREYYGAYAYWDNGSVIFTMEYNTPEYDYPGQDWYTQAVPKDWNRTRARDREVYWSSPFFDSAGTKALMVTVAGVMYDETGRIIGISTLDLSMETLREIVGAISITPSSLAFAVETQSGLVTAYPADNDMVLKPVAELPFGADLARKAAQAQPDRPVEFETVVQGVPYLVFYSVTPTGMGLGIAVHKHELFAGAEALARASTRTAIGAVAALLVLIAVIALALNSAVIRPVRTLADYSRQVAEGNLDAAIAGKHSSEFGVLRTAMESMVASLKDKMREAGQQAEAAHRSAEAAETAKAVAEEATRKAENARTEGMRHAAAQLRDVAQVLASASEDLRNHIDLSSQGARTQASRMDETATAMEEMSASVLEIARSAESTATLAESSRSAAGDGARQFGKVRDDFTAINEGFQGVYHAVDDLSAKADGIGAIAQTIEDIADQTNLLALNAAIEAARAGDAGRGFAVVADEVRKLAEKTMTATKEVGQSISAIQQAVRGTLTGMDGTRAVLDSSREGVQAAGQLLERIVELARQSSDQVRSIATAAEEQSSATEEINHSIGEVNRISTETAQAMDGALRAVAEAGQQVTVLRELIAELER